MRSALAVHGARDKDQLEYNVTLVWMVSNGAQTSKRSVGSVSSTNSYGLPDIRPILDTSVWPDELAQCPPELGPMTPWMFLQATSTSYYVYNLEDTTMFKVGSELSDIVDGLQRERWCEEEL